MIFTISESPPLATTEPIEELAGLAAQPLVDYGLNSLKFIFDPGHSKVPTLGQRTGHFKSRQKLLPKTKQMAYGKRKRSRAVTTSKKRRRVAGHVSKPSTVTGRKHRASRKRRRSRPRRKVALRTRISRLEKDVDGGHSTAIRYASLPLARLPIADYAEASSVSYDVNTYNRVSQAFDKNGTASTEISGFPWVPVYDEDANTHQLIDLNADTSANSGKHYQLSMLNRFEVYNGEGFPVELDIFHYEAKEDTNEDPLSLATTWLNQVGGNPTNTSIGNLAALNTITNTDAQNLRDLEASTFHNAVFLDAKIKKEYKIKHNTVTLRPGGRHVYYTKAKRTIKCSNFNDHTEIYQPRLGSGVVTFRVKGVRGLPLLNEQGGIAAGSGLVEMPVERVGIDHRIRYKYRYMSGGPVSYRTLKEVDLRDGSTAKYDTSTPAGAAVTVISTNHSLNRAYGRTIVTEERDQHNQA